MTPIDLDSLGDQPLSDVPTLSIEAESLVEWCNRLLDNPKASWAWDTVEDIRATLYRTGKMTPGQGRAIDNIRHAVERQEEAGADKRTRGGGRRYEGWSR